MNIQEMIAIANHTGGQGTDHVFSLPKNSGNRRQQTFFNEDDYQFYLELMSVSRKINTSYVERNNGTIRHIDARYSSKTYRFSKIKENHEHQLSLSLAYYHLCRPHRMLIKRYGKPTTPFMAAGLTDHIWSMKELTFKPENHCR